MADCFLLCQATEPVEGGKGKPHPVRNGLQNEPCMPLPCVTLQHKPSIQSAEVRVYTPGQKIGTPLELSWLDTRLYDRPAPEKYTW